MIKSTAIGGEGLLTTSASKHYKEDWIHEAKRNAKNVFVNNSRQEEDGCHGNGTVTNT